MRKFAVRPALTMSGRASKGLRGMAGKPLHPPLTDVPIAAYLLAAVFDVLSVILYSSRVGVSSPGDGMAPRVLHGAWFRPDPAVRRSGERLGDWPAWSSC